MKVFFALLALWTLFASIVCNAQTIDSDLLLLGKKGSSGDLLIKTRDNGYLKKYHNGDWYFSPDGVSESKIGTGIAAGVPTGAIFPYSATTAPEGFLLCDGKRVSRTTYSDLFAVIGTSYGEGDGSTTFNLPDYRWTFARGHGGNLTATGSGSVASNKLTFTGHGFNRSGVKVRLTSGTLSGLSASTDYFTIYVDDDTLAFATTRANALTGTKITISAPSSPVISQWEDPSVASRVAISEGGGTGGGIGSYQTDAFQGHRHSMKTKNGGADTYSNAIQYAGTYNVTDTQAILDPISDGTNGTPRTDSETRPQNLSAAYIIKF
jgi:microcystin-dependent protein